MGEKEDPEVYLKRRRIRELFQSLMAAILFHKPEDHVGFLIECLTKLHEDPLAVFHVRWNSFIAPEAIPRGAKQPGSSSSADRDPMAAARDHDMPDNLNAQLKTFMTGTGYLY